MKAETVGFDFCYSITTYHLSLKLEIQEAEECEKEMLRIREV